MSAQLLESSTFNAPHVRSMEGIKSVAQNHWRNQPLTGCYLVKNTLETADSNNGQAVILCPGGFDPYRGSYSETAIRNILNVPSVAAAYEVHFSFQDNPGALDPTTYIQDLKQIYLQANAPIVIAMSISTFMVCSALFEVYNEQKTTDSPHSLVIGPIVPEHRNLLGKCLRPFYERDSMREKIIHHCGHKNVFTNGDALLDWWHQPPLVRQQVEARNIKDLASQIGTRLDALPFKIDTLSMKGQRILKQMFGANYLSPKIPKHHRSLLQIPEVDAFLPRYCSD